MLAQEKALKILEMSELLTSARSRRSYLLMRATSLLVVQSDRDAAGAFAARLERAGFHVVSESDALRALSSVIASPAAVIVNGDIAPFDGPELCRRLRETSALPVMLLVEKYQESDCVAALEAGADEYLVKPLGDRELVARINALLRRANGELNTRTIQLGTLTVNVLAHQAELKGVPLRLTHYEFKLLRVLAERAGTVLARERLLELVRGNAEEAFDRSIDVHICRLRAKLGDDSRRPQVLRTVRGAGYCLSPAA